jgi:ABC-type uncharacterized transport system substrate-binding protein
MRRVGVLMSTAADDRVSRARLAAFVQGLQEQGWTVDHNMQLDIRFAAGEPELFRRYAAELVAFAPDVILGAVTSSVRALLEVTRTIPIVFAAARALAPGANFDTEGASLTGNNRNIATSATSTRISARRGLTIRSSYRRSNDDYRDQRNFPTP